MSETRTYGDVVSPMGIKTQDDVKKHDSPLYDKTSGEYPDSFSKMLDYIPEAPYKLTAFDFSDIATPQATYTNPNSPKWKAAMNRHEQHVKYALKTKQKIPLKVLVDYPDFLLQYVEQNKVK